jgi:hypothetical protein
MCTEVMGSMAMKNSLVMKAAMLKRSHEKRWEVNKKW